jgi:hypothetical protein
MPSEPMRWSKLQRQVDAVEAFGMSDKLRNAVGRIRHAIDAAAPAMEEQERIVEAVLAWGRILNTSEPDDSLFVPQKMAMVKVRDLAQKLAAERAKGATDGPR